MVWTLHEVEDLSAGFWGYEQAEEAPRRKSGKTGWGSEAGSSSRVVQEPGGGEGWGRTEAWGQAHLRYVLGNTWMCPGGQTGLARTGGVDPGGVGSEAGEVSETQAWVL